MPDKTATPWSDWSDANSKAIEAAEGASERAPSEQSAHKARLASGSALPRDLVEQAERYTEKFCSLTDITCGGSYTRFHAAVLLHELRRIRRYCSALEEQLDEFGLKAAQRAAGLSEPNVPGQT